MKHFLKHLLPASALIAVLWGGSAYAVPVDTLSASVSVSEQYNSAHGGPSVSGLIGGGTISGLSVPIGSLGSHHSAFTLNPAGSCSGGGCVGGSNGTETDLITFSFSNVKVNGGTPFSFSETGTFTAKYHGSELSCAVGDGVSPSSGQTDCLVWTGASNTWNGSTILSESIPGTGNTLDVVFYNKTDWSVTPAIAFEVVDAPAVAEPSTFAILGIGVLGLIAFGRRPTYR